MRGDGTSEMVGLDVLGAGRKAMEELEPDLFASSAYAPSQKTVLDDVFETGCDILPSGVIGELITPDEKTVETLREVTVLRKVLASLEGPCEDTSSVLLRDWDFPVRLLCVCM